MKKIIEYFKNGTRVKKLEKYINELHLYTQKFKIWDIVYKVENFKPSPKYTIKSFVERWDKKICVILQNSKWNCLVAETENLYKLIK